MADLSTIRHEAIFDPKKHGSVPISIIGLGATGSRVFASLVELGCTNMKLFDPDVVEAHNLANQIYLAEHIGTPKVGACADWYRYKTGADIPIASRFLDIAVPCEEPVTGIVFLLTDSMQSRKEIGEACIKDNDDVFFVIETRMASTHGNVFSFAPSQYDEWVATLSDDETTELSACGSTISVGPTAAIIANLAVWQFINFLTNPAALDPRIDVFLKPMAFNASRSLG